MEKRLFTFIACLFLSIGMALAQTRVNGTVISSEDGQPVVGASVKVVGTNTGTATDSEGRFSLSVPQGSKLEISYIGMLKKTVKASRDMKVYLDPDQQNLDEVMVVAYGTEKKSAFTGSAAVVGNDEITKVQVSSPVESLKGKVAGVQMTNASGAPGSTSSIRIRGISSITAGNAPLIVVDGVPYDGDLNTINPVDVENITVLKDASSSALYGARGANGVIIITTKRVKPGQGTITFDAKLGSNSRAVPDYDYVDSPAKYYEMWYAGLKNYAVNELGYTDSQAQSFANTNLTADNEYGLAYNVYTVPEGQTLIGSNGKLNPNATLGRLISYNGNSYYLYPDDWSDETYSNGLRQEYNLNATGSNDRGSFYTSFNYLKNEGLTVSSNYERYNGRFKADYKIKDWLKIGGNLNYAHYRYDGTNDEGSSGSSGNVFALTKMGPIYPMYIRDANGNKMVDSRSGIYYYDYGDGSIIGLTRPYLSQSNPLSDNQVNERKTEGNTFNVTGTAEITLPYGFKFTSINNVYDDELRYTSTTNPWYGQYASSNGIVVKEHDRYYSYDLQQLLNWAQSYGKNNVSATLGHDYYNYRSYYLYGDKSNQFSPDNDELDGAVTTNSVGSGRSTYNTESYFIRGLYNWDERYFAEASFMRQASSRFDKDHRWGSFWSLGGAWLISKEKWFKADWVDELRFKLSYGETGNDNIDNYLYTDRYSVVNSDGNAALKPSSVKGNSDLTWETVGEFNTGLEFSLWKSRLSGSFEFFSRKTSDMLYSFSLPVSSGYTSYYDNIGDMINNGIEFSLNGDIIRTKDLVWSVNMNITHVHNYVSSLPDEKKTMTVEGVDGYTSGSYFVGEGISLYTWYLHKYAGVDPETGESLFYKTTTNDDGTETTTTVTNPSEASYYLCGGSMAQWYGGFGTSFAWKGLDFSCSFAYQLGGKIYDSDYQESMSFERGAAFHTDLLKAWSTDNTNTDVPRMQFNDTYMGASSDRWLTNASYLSLQNIQLGYTLPTKWVRTLGLSKVRIYCTADNVWLWSHRQGLDPRQTIAGSGNSSYAPYMRTISGGLTVTF